MVELPRNIISIRTPSTALSWRTGGVFTRFLMLDLDETFSKASNGYYDTLMTSPDPFRTSISSKTLGRDLEDRWSLDKIPDV